jgi:hypothetical protein
MILIIWCLHDICMIDEEAAEEEAAKAKQEGSKAYAQADVVVALAGWDENSAKPAAEGALRALKFLLEGDKELPSKYAYPS